MFTQSTAKQIAIIGYALAAAGIVLYSFGVIVLTSVAATFGGFLTAIVGSAIWSSGRAIGWWLCCGADVDRGDRFDGLRATLHFYLHYAVSNVEGWSHPISPRRAVRFHFIPVFNLYWDFKWPKEIARFVDWRMQRNRMSGVLVGMLVLIGFLIGGFLDVSIGLLVIVSTFAYISRCLREAFSASPVLPGLENVSFNARSFLE